MRASRKIFATVGMVLALICAVPATSVFAAEGDEWAETIIDEESHEEAKTVEVVESHEETVVEEHHEEQSADNACEAPAAEDVVVVETTTNGSESQDETQETTGEATVVDGNIVVDGKVLIEIREGSEEEIWTPDEPSEPETPDVPSEPEQPSIPDEPSEPETPDVPEEEHHEPQHTNDAPAPVPAVEEVKEEKIILVTPDVTCKEHDVFTEQPAEEPAPVETVYVAPEAPEHKVIRANSNPLTADDSRMTFYMFVMIMSLVAAIAWVLVNVFGKDSEDVAIDKFDKTMVTVMGAPVAGCAVAVAGMTVAGMANTIDAAPILANLEGIVAALVMVATCAAILVVRRNKRQYRKK